MHQIARPILISLLALGLTGCGAGRPIRYYTIQLPPAPTRSTNTYPVSLLVSSISGPGIYQDTPIAYRIGTNEIGTYQFSRWAEPPVEMLKSKLIRVLDASGDYQSVASLGSASDGQFVVRGKLYDFEEVDSASIAGLVSMEFELYDRKSGKVVWSHFYSQSQPVQGKEISAVVTALDVNLDRGLKEVAAGLNQYFSANLAAKS
ncbi:MAG: ABC-type transport auxiliary lipoprotein family protein [Candidatus Korobacteraceae bacterium]